MKPTLISAIGTFLQLAVIADLEYGQAKANGTASLLQPGNFQSALNAVATALSELPQAPTTPATPPVAAQQ